MLHQDKIFNQTVHLSDRRLIAVRDEDARSFLQNIMTNDIALADKMGIVYSCLLTPQGQFLNDFFVVKQEDGYLIDIEEGQADDFKRRIMIFKLRAKVDVTEANDRYVYTRCEGLNDPRSDQLGARDYVTDSINTDGEISDYDDFCISIGIPNGLKTIRPEKDIVADVNLDFLSAVGWEKGCFIGQEVTARMKYRGLAKKRLMIVGGENLSQGALLTAEGRDIGDIRQVNRNQTTALAIVKIRELESLDQEAGVYKNGRISLTLPDYLNLS